MFQSNSSRRTSRESIQYCAKVLPVTALRIKLICMIITTLRPDDVLFHLHENPVMSVWAMRHTGKRTFFHSTALMHNNQCVVKYFDLFIRAYLG